MISDNVIKHIDVDGNVHYRKLQSFAKSDSLIFPDGGDGKSPDFEPDHKVEPVEHIHGVECNHPWEGIFKLSITIFTFKFIEGGGGRAPVGSVNAYHDEL